MKNKLYQLGLVLGLFAFASACSPVAQFEPYSEEAVVVHELSPIKEMTQVRLQKFYDIADLLDKKSEFVVSQGYKITSSVDKKPGESSADAFLRVVKFALHRDFPITGDDGGYSFTQFYRNVKPEYIEKEGSLESFTDIAEEVTQLTSALSDAAKAGFLVLSGSGSGNNTSANIYVVIDQKNKEFVYLMESNFGSDGK